MILLQRPAVCARMRKASGCHPTGFSNPNDRISIIMAKYIVIHGIRIDKDYQDFVPETFGRLTTIGPRFLVGVKSYQVCECCCGSIVIVRCNNLNTGHAQSCGCLQKDQIAASRRTHGLSGAPNYTIWRLMLARCYDTHRKEYANYGGRGIGVCKEWADPQTGCDAFHTDMGPRPGPEYTVDRYPDRNGNYEPGNCRWATKKQQSRNRRNNRQLTAFGQTRCLAEWAEIYKIRASNLQHRLTSGMSVEEALTRPVRKKRRNNAGN